MNDIQQRIAAMSQSEASDVLLELVTALHAEDTNRAYKILRDAGLEQDLTPDDGTSGQDRESYSDTQDRENYQPDDGEVELKWHNFYKCPRCGHEWEDDWDCQCDDDCGECGNRHISPYKSEEIKSADTTAVAAEETTFPIKVRVVMEAEGGWSDEQLAWIKANQGKVVTGKMVFWDEFRPDGAPLILYADDYEVVESTTEWQDSPDFAKSDATIHSYDYTPDVFRQFFTSPFDQYKERIGQHFTVLGHDTEAEKDLEQPEDMYKIRFDDGTEITAWGHEVCVLNYRNCK